jgi:hypothetical protein
VEPTSQAVNANLSVVSLQSERVTVSFTHVAITYKDVEPRISKYSHVDVITMILIDLINAYPYYGCTFICTYFNNTELSVHYSTSQYGVMQ